MTIHTARPARHWLALVWVALLVATSLLLPALPVRGASSVQIEARALVAGRYVASGWMAISVTLVNDGEPTDGVLATTTDAGNVERYVEMPAGARKVVMLYVQPEAFQRRLTIEYREPNGTVQAVVETRVFEQSSNQVAVVGDGAGNLRPQLTTADAQGQPAPIALTLADLPERAEPLDGIHAMVWADDSTALSEDQRRSIARWVAEGGELVVIGGPDWQARLGGFEDLLPLEEVSAVDDVPQAALAAWAGSEAPPSETATVSTGTLRSDARQLVAAEDGTVLASMRNVGGGRVILLGVDMATAEHRTWDGGTRLWARLLPSNAAFEEFFGGFVPVEEMQNAMGNALSNLPSLEVPPAELLLAVIVAYILLIGPVSYVVLRRMDRREMAWITAPVLVIVFTAGSFGIGNSMKGTSIIVNRISVLRTSGIDASASAETYAGIFSPDRATYTVTAEADALLGRMRPLNFQGNEPSSEVILEQGNPAHLRNLAIGVFGFEAVRADAIVDHASSLSVSWHSEDGEIVGTVTNVGDATVQDVAFISSSGGELVERELAPGASAEFSVESTNFNGSSASDQVYGFGGFDNASEAQRRIIVRRQVIDALVGFGGFAPGMEFGAGSARGPFVIGWTDDAGPVPIVLDDVTAQEYAQSVEVVNVRPGVGSGEVVVRPAQMSVSLVATEGDAGSGGGGTVIIGDGSATFSIALPLEASDMSVTEVEIIVGPDPSVVLNDPGGFGGPGFWPVGYTLEVRNPVSGAWTELGDISEQSRFDIDDPSTAVSDSGRIEVRVTGVGVDPNFGQTGVFVSAQARGVIGE